MLCPEALKYNPLIFSWCIFHNFDSFIHFFSLTNAPYSDKIKRGQFWPPCEVILLAFILPAPEITEMTFN